MRLVTFSADGDVHLGAWIDNDEQIVDLTRAGESFGSKAATFRSMQALIDGGPDAQEGARSLVAGAKAEYILSTGDVELLAPLPRPIQMRDFLAFPGHVQGCLVTAAEMAVEASPTPAQTRAALMAAGKFDLPSAFFDGPVYYICNSMAVKAPGADVLWPEVSSFIDYELEFAAVIGKAGQAVSRDRAREHIFGYTIFNDWSARDEQMKAMASPMKGGGAPGKDFANSLGPCIVTSDELEDPYALAMKAYVNGELQSSGNSASMHYRFEDMIAYISRSSPIYPGEVFGSGTVGTGCALETRSVLWDGDVVTLEVESIGQLRNRVAAPHLRGQARLEFGATLSNALQKALGN